MNTFILPPFDSHTYQSLALTIPPSYLTFGVPLKTHNCFGECIVTENTSFVPEQPIYNNTSTHSLNNPALFSFCAIAFAYGIPGVILNEMDASYSRYVEL